MIELFVAAFATFFVVIDPPGCAPIYAGLTSDAPRRERRTERRENRAQEVSASEVEDISVFPMAIPMIAGPGSIASAMLLMARSDGPTESLLVLGALLATLVLTLIALLAAGPLMRLLGHKMEAMITRLLGVILAALAVQFVVDGIRRSFF